MHHTRHEFDSQVADMKNSVKNRANAQCSCAGMFIYRHLAATDSKAGWVHIDMPSVFNERATGYGPALIIEALGM